MEIQITEYGQTPKQIFSKPHPKRFSAKISDDFIKEKESNFHVTKHINFTEKDFELVENIDDNFLGFSHINIRINDEFYDDTNNDLIIDKKDFNSSNLLSPQTHGEDIEEKKYFDDLKNKIKFDVINRHHKK